MRGQSTPFRDQCLNLARRQHGVVARSQLTGIGIPPTTVDSGLPSGFLFPVFTSVYSVGRPELSVHGLWMAAVLAAGPGAALAGRTAAIAWGFQNRPASPVKVVRPGHDGKKEPAKLKAEGHYSCVQLAISRCRWLDRKHVTRLLGVPILQIEPLLLQLAGEMRAEEFRYAFWEADRMKGLDDRRLARCVELSHGRRGGWMFRESVDCRMPHIQEALSLLEVLLMELGRRGEIPPPEVNRNEAGHLVDFRWPARLLAVEVDGYEFHRGHGSFERDAERNNDLRARGWTVLRFTYRMLKYRPDYVVETILKALQSHPSDHPAGMSTK